MSMSMQQTQRFNSWLEGSVGLTKLNCGVCGNNDYDTDIVAAIPQQGVMSFDVAAIPASYVAASCRRCGNTLFFNTSICGLDNPDAI